MDANAADVRIAEVPACAGMGGNAASARNVEGAACAIMGESAAGASIVEGAACAIMIANAAGARNAHRSGQRSVSTGVFAASARSAEGRRPVGSALPWMLA